MSEEYNEQEDSMEDILSSIRNILTDEAGDSLAPEDAGIKTEEIIKLEELSSEKKEKEETVVDSLGDSMIEIKNKDVSSENILELSDNMIVKNEESNLVSEKVVDASANAISGMAKTIVAEKQIALGDSAITLEAITKELLNPLIKDWLEKNLSNIVEKVVTKEVERVIEKVSR